MITNDGFCKLLTLVLITRTFFWQIFHKKPLSEKKIFTKISFYNKAKPQHILNFL